MYKKAVVRGRCKGEFEVIVLHIKTEVTLKGMIKNIQIDFISLVRKGANQKEIIFKAGNAFTKSIEIKKIDDEKRMVYGIVYSPDEVDSQGQYSTAAEIEKAAEIFMKAGRTKMIDKNHDEIAGQGFIKESWIKKDVEPLFPNEKNGSWIVGIKIENENTWEEIKQGDVAGLSMQGSATVEHDTSGTFQGEEMTQCENNFKNSFLQKIKELWIALKKERNSDCELSAIKNIIYSFYDSCINELEHKNTKEEILILKIKDNYNLMISKLNKLQKTSYIENIEENDKIEKEAMTAESKMDLLVSKIDELKKEIGGRIELIEKAETGTKQILDPSFQRKKLNWEWL